MIEQEQAHRLGPPRPRRTVHAAGTGPSPNAPADRPGRPRTAMAGHHLEHAVKDDIFAYNRFLTRDGCYFSQPEGMIRSHTSLSGA